jgi:hypothetical protein
MHPQKSYPIETGTGSIKPIGLCQRKDVSHQATIDGSGLADPESRFRGPFAMSPLDRVGRQGAARLQSRPEDELDHQ